MRLDLEPEPVTGLRVPDRGYFGSRVARDHETRLLLRVRAQPLAESQQCWRDSRRKNGRP
jgi:hypothetical protein